MKFLKTIVCCLLVAAIFGCSNNDDDGASDEGQLPIIFNVDPLFYKQYDIDIDPNFSNVQVYAWAVFTVQPTATKYTLTYTSESPNLDFSISWENGQAIPDPGAPPPGWIPGYELGIINGQYYIVILGAGCQGAPGGPCSVNGSTANDIESGLRSIDGTVEVRVDFQ